MSSLDVLWIEKLNEKVSVKVKEICHIWAEIGIDGARLQARKESLQSYLFTMLDEMYDEEVAAQQTLVKSIKDLEVKVDELETELEFTAAPLGDSLSLVLKEKALFDRFKSLEERALSITETFNSLRNEEEQLSARLGEPTAVIFFKHVPNQQQMRSLKTNIDYLTMEKRSRVLHLSELRQDIVSIRAALESDTSLDADLLSRITQEDALDVLPLTAEFLAQVEALRQKCDSRLSEIESECINLTGEVLSLATRLNLEREEILDLEQPVSASFLKLLKEEVARLAELRRLNLSVFIENCRNELGHWWDECYLSELQRNVITVEPGEYTETVLSALESEIDRLKVFHALHQPVFDTIKEWQTTFSRFRNTEMKKKDPIVLKNRGGILLRVEKEYKQLQRDLKRLETELHRLASDPIHLELRVHGMPVLEFLDESKRQYDEDKENEVKQKKELQKKIKEIEQRFGCDATRAIYGKRPGTRALPNQTMLARNGPGSATRINAGSSASKKPRMESGKDALSSFASSGTSTLSRELCGSPVASSSFRESTMRSATSGGVRTPRTGTLPKTPQSTSSSLTVAQRIKQQVSHSTTRTALSGHKTTKTPVTSHKLALTSTTTPTRQFLIPSGCPPRSARKL